jgi:DNA processing protein
MSPLPDHAEHVQERAEAADDATLAAELRLCMVSGVGPLMRKKLLERFGSAAGVFKAAPSELREVDGVGPKLVREITAAEREINVENEIAYCRENRITLLLESNAAYPRPLKDIHDPPGVLFVRGEVLPVDALAVAIVGTRHATAYGLAQAERLASGLAHAGYTIISGLARGIDAAAHSGAMKAGGRTLAVLGSGVMEIYPPEHENLAQQVMEHGAIISESHPLSPPLTGTFPQRNRIISGMSLGVIVVEASDRSGALITARHAMEQGREVFAVPGRVDSRNSRGCHKLIRDGAKLTETVDDVLEEFGPLVAAAPRDDGREIRHPVELQLNEPETAVLTAIGTDPTSIDEVISTSGLAVPQVLSTISVLEMKRLIRRLSGNKVIRL